MHCSDCDVKMEDVKRKGGFHGKTKYVCPKCDRKVFVENKRGNNSKGGGKSSKSGKAFY